MLREHSPILRTLVLGSSHGEHGFDPAFCPESFNLCLRLMDLKHACALYERVGPSCPRLETVVVFYSIGSGSNYSERARHQGEVCAALEEVFGLGLRYGSPDVMALIERARGRIVGMPEDMRGRAGFQPHALGDFIYEASGRGRAAVHLLLAKRTDGDLSLLRMLLLARRRGHRVVVVTPPMRSDYVDAARGPSRRIFRNLSRMLFRDPHGCAVQWVNGFDSGEFDDADFFDGDHLLPDGPGTRRLSLRIRDAVASGRLGAHQAPG
jgi:hypothetical protein